MNNSNKTRGFGDLGWIAVIMGVMGLLTVAAHAGHDDQDHKSVKVKVDRGPFSFSIGYRDGRFVPTIHRHVPKQTVVHRPAPRPVCTTTRCIHKQGYSKCGVAVCRDRYTRDCQVKARAKTKVVVHRHGSQGHRHAPVANGWDLFQQCRFGAAVKAFERAVDCDPYQTRSRLGLAIARAKIGDEAGAVRAMRRVVFQDVNVLKRVSLDRGVRKMVGQLAHDVSHHAATCRDGNLRFLSAALNVIRADYSAAKMQIHRAAAMGDRSLSTRKLHQMIEQQLNPPSYRRPTYQTHRGHYHGRTVSYSRHGRHH